MWQLPQLLPVHTVIPQWATGTQWLWASNSWPLKPQVMMLTTKPPSTTITGQCSQIHNYFQTFMTDNKLYILRSLHLKSPNCKSSFCSILQQKITSCVIRPDSRHVPISTLIKLCPWGSTHKCAPTFCCRDLDINPMTLKLKGDLDILKMYLQTENEVARLRHSKLLTLHEIGMAITSKMKNMKITQDQRSNVINFQRLPACTMGHIPNKLHQFLRSGFRDFVHRDIHTNRQTLPETIPAHIIQYFPRHLQYIATQLNNFKSPAVKNYRVQHKSVQQWIKQFCRNDNVSLYNFLHLFINFVYIAIFTKSGGPMLEMANMGKLNHQYSDERTYGQPRNTTNPAHTIEIKVKANRTCNRRQIQFWVNMTQQVVEGCWLADHRSQLCLHRRQSAGRRFCCPSLLLRRHADTGPWHRLSHSPGHRLWFDLSADSWCKLWTETKQD